MAKYRHISEESVEKDPFVQFSNWYLERLSSGVLNPESFSLATADPHTGVSVRIVLLKAYTREGFVFFTNYNSRKARQLASNNRAAMLFYWPESGRQIRIEGRTQKVTPDESELYFVSRPRKSRLSAWASEQSTMVPDREYLEKRLGYFTDKFKGESVPLPPFWGGYRITPLYFEFWQEGAARMHDRIVYQPAGDGWRITRIAP